MSLIWTSISRRNPAVAALICSSVSAARMAFQASSGNFASMTSDGAPFGMLTRQSGPVAVRQGCLELKGTHWQAIGNDCFHPALAESTAGLFVRQDGLQLDHLVLPGDWMLFWAVSMTASRSCNLARFSWVDLVCSLIVLPMRLVMPSSRSRIDWLSSACREPNSSAMVCMRPCISPCAFNISAMRVSASRARSAAIASAAARVLAPLHWAMIMNTSPATSSSTPASNTSRSGDDGRTDLPHRLG